MPDQCYQAAVYWRQNAGYSGAYLRQLPGDKSAFLRSPVISGTMAAGCRVYQAECYLLSDSIGSPPYLSRVACNRANKHTVKTSDSRETLDQV